MGAWRFVVDFGTVSLVADFVYGLLCDVAPAPADHRRCLHPGRLLLPLVVTRPGRTSTTT
ncbi:MULTISPECIES: hypothetical protein [unclassified Streptomyces]|uniref:hypothetical protein n=1 Tax=unclassified Streptomyces TaxID=2593676 RepID=UPI0024A9DC93|nr:MULTISPECIES: hypothetical protein [unclassified Streptomyces]